MVLPRSLNRGNLRWIVLGVVALVLILLGVFRYDGPAYRSDEIGYLSKAAALGGKQNNLASSWYGGYSLLLSPFFHFAESVREAWPAVVVLNVVAVIVTLACLWHSLRVTGVTDTERGFRIILLGLLVLGTTAYVGWAFVNCLLMALIAATALLLSPGSLSLARAAGVGLVMGFATWVHPSGLIVLAGASLASLWPQGGRPNLRPSLLILVIGLPMAFAYAGLFHPWILSLQGGAGEGHYKGQMGEYLNLLLTSPLATLAILTVAITNGIATSSIATYGYLGSSLLGFPRPLSQGAPPAAPPTNGTEGLRRVLLFLLISWGGLVLFSAPLALDAPGSLHLAFQQRYIQPVLPSLVAFGMALEPASRHKRLRIWLISAVPILLALLVALFLRRYDDNFSVVDNLGAATIFLGKENVPLMLAAGIVVIGIVQLAGWRAYLVLAGGLWLLGWQRIDHIHRQILQSNSRQPAMVMAAATVKQAGLQPCVQLAATRTTPYEHDLVMRYYLSGLGVRQIDAAAPTYGSCDVIIRPMDSGAAPETRRPGKGERACRPRILDTFSDQVLEVCRHDATYDSAAIQALLLPSSRDLIDLQRALRLAPPGHRIAAAIHTEAMLPEKRRRGLARRQVAGAGPLIKVNRGESILYGPYLSLPAGSYQAVFDGLQLAAGSLTMDVSSEAGKRQHASTVLHPGTTSRAVLPFRLQAPTEAVEVRLIADSPGSMRLPTSLVIYRAR